MACTDIPTLPIALPTGIPGCCTTPSLDFSVLISRTNAVVCDPTLPETHTAVLTFNGTDTFTGTFAFRSDTYTVALTTSGATWTLTITNGGGCGLSGLTYSRSAASPFGPWPDALVSGPGSCGCGTMYVQYSDLTITG